MSMQEREVPAEDGNGGNAWRCILMRERERERERESSLEFGWCVSALSQALFSQVSTFWQHYILTTN